MTIVLYTPKYSYFYLNLEWILPSFLQSGDENKINADKILSIVCGTYWAFYKYTRIIVFITIPILLGRKNSFGILIHFLMGALFFQERMTEILLFRSSDISSWVDCLMLKVSFLNVLWTCVPTTLAERLDTSGLLVQRDCEAPPTCETRSCGLFFIRITWLSCWFFFVSSTLKSIGLFIRVGKTGDLSLGHNRVK